MDGIFQQEAYGACRARYYWFSAPIRIPAAQVEAHSSIELQITATGTNSNIGEYIWLERLD